MAGPNHSSPYQIKSGAGVQKSGTFRAPSAPSDAAVRRFVVVVAYSAGPSCRHTVSASSSSQNAHTRPSSVRGGLGRTVANLLAFVHTSRGLVIFVETPDGLELPVAGHLDQYTALLSLGKRQGDRLAPGLPEHRGDSARVEPAASTGAPPAVVHRGHPALRDALPPGRGAALPGGADGAEGDAPHSEIEVGIFLHQDGVVAPQLKQAAPEPVALMRGSRGSRIICSPTSASAPTTRGNRPGKPGSAATADRIRCVAMAVSGAFSDGFHRTVSPQIRATMAFQAQTAFGKLKAVITPMGSSGPQGVPLLVHAMAGPLAVHGQPEELAGHADRQVDHVEALLHLSQAFTQDLADLHRHQAKEILLVLPKGVAHLAHDLAALGGR